jgi:uncharacterized damage-inducible protein DinB
MLMLAAAMRTFYDYNHWATEKIMNAAACLTQEQLDEPGTAGHGSIRQTLLHMIDTHKGWLSWWDGSLSAQDAMMLSLDPADYPDLAAVRRAWDALAEQTRAFTGTLSDEDMERTFTTEIPDGSAVTFVLWKMMLHVANHGTQHRSEIAAMLTVFDCSPGDLDIVSYDFELMQQSAG